MKLQKAWLATICTFCCACSGDSARSRAIADRTPALVPTDWVVVSPPDHKSPAAVCVNWSRDNWHVSLSRDSTRLEIRPQLRSEKVNSSVLHVAGGVLSGWDEGEFGGGIVWRDQRGVVDTIVRENFTGFVKTSDRILALVGAGGFALDAGRIVQLDSLPGNRWRTSTLVDLGGFPLVYTTLPADSLLLGTFNSILVAHGTETPTTIFRTPAPYYANANSIVRDRAGIIFVGTRRAVGRFTPSVNGMHEEWLVPDTCATLRFTSMPNEPCACVAARS